MQIDDNFTDEKLQDEINRKAAKVSALSSSQMNILRVKKYYLLVQAK